MRPVRIEIEGLRSFRAPQVIDFTGRDYVAIIGDTGAGKSSILEAMTFALFGRTTFSGQGHQELMNASSTALRVVFAFEVDGKAWEAARTLRRAGSGTVNTGPVSLKQLAPDGSPIAAFEGARPVTAQVERILGLDADAFLRTVVLPQGQFSRLLVDDDQRQRSSVLRQIWRTDELTDAGALADAALRELMPLQARVAQALLAEPPDAEAHLSMLEAELARRITIRDTTRARQQSATSAAGALAAADHHVERCDAVIVELSKWDGATAAATAAQLVAAGARFDDVLASAAASLEELSQRAAAIPDDDDDGYAAAEISRFSVLLQQLPGLVSQRDQASADVAAAAAALEGLHVQLETSARTAEAATAELSARLADRTSLSAAAEAAIARRTRASSALDAARRAQRSVVEADTAVGEAEAAIAAHTTALGDAQAVLDQAREVADAAVAARTAAQRANAAATAAHGLHVGDPCPVCARALEPAWVRPVAPGLDAAEQAAKDGLVALEGAQQTAARIEARRHAAEEAAGSARGALVRAVAAARAALGELERELGAAADLARTDAELLGSVDAEVEGAQATLAAHDELIQQARAAEAAYGATKAAAETAHRDKAEQLAALAVRRDGADRAVADHLAGLPDELRPIVPNPASASLSGLAPDSRWGSGPVPDSGSGSGPVPDLGSGSDLSSGAGSLTVGAALAALASRQSVLAERQAARQHVARESERARARQRALEQARTVEVAEPAAALWTTVVSRAGALERVASDLGQPMPLPVTTRRPSLAELPAQVSLITDATEGLGAAAQALSAAARQSADDAARLLADLAAEAGLATADQERTLAAIAEAAEDAAYDARAAQARTDAFRARVPVITALREAASDLDARVLALTDLAAGLRDGAFPKWLTLRRSRSLLVHASRLLSEISAGRYAFADLDDADSQWFVFDNDHGQPRSPSSLSGGEKFVASLSLALGMVEMMGRQGDRIGSLFLDEGFGALDRTNLDAAVEALASVASTGRMVAVITHLSAVAEQIDDILAVSCGATGTKVAWLDAAERAALSERSTGAERGLDARSGLLE